MLVCWIPFQNRAWKTESKIKIQLQLHFQVGKLIYFLKSRFWFPCLPLPLPYHLQSLSNSWEWVAATSSMLLEKSLIFIWMKITIIQRIWQRYGWCYIDPITNCLAFWNTAPHSWDSRLYFLKSPLTNSSSQGHPRAGFALSPCSGSDKSLLPDSIPSCHCWSCPATSALWSIWHLWAKQDPCKEPIRWSAYWLWFPFLRVCLGQPHSLAYVFPNHFPLLHAHKHHTVLLGSECRLLLQPNAEWKNALVLNNNLCKWSLPMLLFSLS